MVSAFYTEPNQANHASSALHLVSKVEECIKSAPEKKNLFNKQGTRTGQVFAKKKDWTKLRLWPCLQ